jgi:L-iditol 2-dehydrogenase
MRAAVLVGPGRIEIEERPVPLPAPDDVLVRVSTVGVCGSDTHYYRHGRVGSFVVDAPLVLGHEAAGTIVSVGADVDPSRVGQRVSIEPQRPDPDSEETRRGDYHLCPHMQFFATPPVDGAFCEYVTIGAAFAHPVPATITDETRRTRALEFGATAVLDPNVHELVVNGVDAFVDASGAPAAVAAGIGAVRPAGTVVLVGSGVESMTLPTQLIQNRELVLTGVFRYANTWPTAIALVESGRVDLDAMVTARFSLEEAAEALDSDRLPGTVKTVVTVS